ncbi:hypothetical protein EAE96_009140 [Botrytis aclada]|nr:hypothetical protein EAE96_009140 [Botrytis aclada]
MYSFPPFWTRNFWKYNGFSDPHPGGRQGWTREHTGSYHLDTQLGERRTEFWTVAEDFAQLYRGYTGAVLKASMRLYDVVEFIPRRYHVSAEVYGSFLKSRYMACISRE